MKLDIGSRLESDFIKRRGYIKLRNQILQIAGELDEKIVNLIMSGENKLKLYVFRDRILLRTKSFPVLTLTRNDFINEGIIVLHNNSEISIEELSKLIIVSLRDHYCKKGKEYLRQFKMPGINSSVYELQINLE